MEERAERDHRVVKRAPLPDAERTPVVRQIEEVLRAETPPAVFQNAVGEVVHIEERRSSLLHLLTSETTAGGVHADLFAPAPATPLITAHTIDSMREAIESRIHYLQDDDERSVTLADGFIRALLPRSSGRRLP